jgi:hypothetical protein
MMATPDDLVSAAVGGLLEDATASAVEGMTWKWDIDVDLLGDPVNFTGATGVCKVADAVDGTLLVTCTVTARTTGVTVSATAASTAALMTAAQNGVFRRATWSCEITTSTSQKFALWTPSEFRILPALGV